MVIVIRVDMHRQMLFRGDDIVLDGILNQSLDGKRQHMVVVVCVMVDAMVKNQVVAIAHLHHQAIGTHTIQLFGQSHHLLVLQAGAQHHRQLLYEILRLLGIVLNQRP